MTTIKDVADLFAAEGEGARKVIEELKEGALDALAVAISEAPPKSDNLGRYRFFRRSCCPCSCASGTRASGGRRWRTSPGS